MCISHVCMRYVFGVLCVLCVVYVCAMYPDTCLCDGFRV
jgi:hypothetical protein